MPPSQDVRQAPVKGARTPSRARWGVLSLLIPVVTGLLLSWHSLTALDIWFHLRAGSDLLNGHGITAVNHYSFTEPDHPWVNHEWLFQVLAALTGPDLSSPLSGDTPSDVTGWNLMRTALTVLLLLTVMGGDGGRSRFFGRDGPSAAAWAGVPILAGLMLLWPRLTTRPEMFSYLFFVLLVRWTEQFFQMSSQEPYQGAVGEGSKGGGWQDFFNPRRPAGRIFLLTVIWAQFHGFASLAPLVVLMGGLLWPLQTRLFPGQVSRQRQGSTPGRKMALVFIVLVALILTPNGWNGLLMPLRALGQFSQDKVDLRTTISELVPLQDSRDVLGLTITVYRASLVWGILWIVATFGRVSLLRILVFALAGLAAWTNQRSIGIYGVSFMLLHTGAGGKPWRFSLPSRWPAIPSKVLALSGLGISLLVAGLLWPQIIRDDFYLREGVARRFGSGVNPARYPIAAAAAMGRQGGRPYFANLDAAAYLLANTSGRIFIDGRTEAYSADLWAEYLNIKRGDEEALRLLAKRRVDTVCLATGGRSFDSLAARLLDSPDWDLWTAEGAGLLFRTADDSPNTAVRSGSPNDILTQAAEQTLAGAERGSATRRADFCIAAGQLYLLAGNDERLEETYRRGLSFKADHPRLNHNLGNLLMNQQRFQDAVPHFLGALEVNPRLAGSALNAGVCQMRLGKPEAAVQSFRRAAAIDPGGFQAWVNLSVALLRNGDRPGAIKALEKALELRPRDPRLQQKLRDLERGMRK